MTNSPFKLDNGKRKLSGAKALAENDCNVCGTNYFEGGIICDNCYSLRVQRCIDMAQEIVELKDKIPDKAEWTLIKEDAEAVLRLTKWNKAIEKEEINKRKELLKKAEANQ